MLVEHALAECAKLLPFVTPVLRTAFVRRVSMNGIADKAYHELLIAYADREVAVERNSEVVRVVPRVGDNMLEKGGLVSQNFRQACTVICQHGPEMIKVDPY